MFRTRKYFCLFITIILITSIFLNLKLETFANEEKDSFVLIVINRVHFNDLAELPTLKSMIDKGSIALMNTRTAGAQNDSKSYATIGWGVRSEAYNNYATFDRINNENSLVYKRRTGKELDNGIINLDINKIIRQNNDGEYGATPGILGESLTKNGLKLALIGNSDFNAIEYNPAGFIAMDNDGYIENGETSSSILEEDPLSPYGIKSNYEEMLKLFTGYYGNADLIVVETGDTYRLEKYRDNLNDESYSHHKELILKDIDDFVYNILHNINLDNTQIMVVAPFASDTYSAQGDRLTPVIHYGKNVNSGVLTSATTRRDGVIGNVDIAPTILNYFNIVPSQMIGNILKSVDLNSNYNYITELNEKIVSTSVHRYRVLYSFAIFQMLISVLTVVVILLAKKYKLNLIKRILAFLLLSALAFPFVLLILTLFGAMEILSIYLLIILITVVLISLCYLFGKGNPLKYIIFITGIVMASLVLDLIFGQNLIRGSIFGYDPIIGARYYGLGNEYMGILIGATLIFAASLLDCYRFNYKYTIPIFIIVLLAIGFPIWGANVGGTITASAVFVFAIMRMSNMKIGLRKIGFIMFSVLITLTIIALVDMFLSENKSHLAGAINQILDEGPVVVFQIIRRKIAMNLRIMRVTVWSRVLLIAMAILAILFYHPIGILKKLNQEYPNTMIGLGCIVLGSIVAFLVNDSGIVAAATIMMFLSTTILYLILSSDKKIID